MSLGHDLVALSLAARAPAAARRLRPGGGSGRVPARRARRHRGAAAVGRPRRVRAARRTLAPGRAPGLAAPFANLSADERFELAVGRAFFRDPWVAAPATTTARDGLGPLFNAHACVSCHPGGGRGALGEDGGATSALLLRLGRPAADGGAPLSGPGVRGSAADARPRSGRCCGRGAGTGARGRRRGRLRRCRRQLRRWRAVHAAPADVAHRRHGVRSAPSRHPGRRPDRALAARRRSSRGHPRAGDPRPCRRGRPRSRRHLRPPEPGARRRPARPLGRFGWKATQPSLRSQVASALRQRSRRHERAPPAAAVHRGAGRLPQGTDGRRPASRHGDLAGAPRCVDELRGDAGRAGARRGPRTRRWSPAAPCSTGAAVPRATRRASSPATPRQLRPARRSGPTPTCCCTTWARDLADQVGEGDAAASEWRTAPLWGLGRRRARAAVRGAAARRACARHRRGDPVARRRGGCVADGLSRPAASRSRGAARVPRDALTTRRTTCCIPTTPSRTAGHPRHAPRPLRHHRRGGGRAAALVRRRRLQRLVRRRGGGSRHAPGAARAAARGSRRARDRAALRGDDAGLHGSRGHRRAALHARDPVVSRRAACGVASRDGRMARGVDHPVRPDPRRQPPPAHRVLAGREQQRRARRAAGAGASRRALGGVSRRAERRRAGLAGDGGAAVRSRHATCCRASPPASARPGAAPSRWRSPATCAGSRSSIESEWRPSEGGWIDQLARRGARQRRVRDARGGDRGDRQQPGHGGRGDQEQPYRGSARRRDDRRRQAVPRRVVPLRQLARERGERAARPRGGVRRRRPSSASTTT